MNKHLNEILLRGFVALAMPGCKLKEEVNPFDSGHLGDRSTYFGASESASECQLKPVLERLYGRAEITMEQKIIIAIGHLVETLIGLVFLAAGRGAQRETALYHPEYPWFRATVDFLWVQKSGNAIIKELKSSKHLMDTPLTSYINQITIQMGLWLANNPGKTVSGALLVVDRTCGKIREFPVEYDHQLFIGLRERAEISWAAIQGTGPMPEPSPNGLCGFCSNRDKCPSGEHTGLAIPEGILSAVRQLTEAKEQIAEATRRADQAKEILIGYAGGKRIKGLNDEYSFSVYSKNGSSRLDKKVLVVELSKHLPEETIQAAIKASSKPSAASTVVECARI